MSNINLKFGNKVPTGAINLAWVTLPILSPENNTFISNVADTLSANNFLTYETIMSGAGSGIDFMLESYGGVSSHKSSSSGVRAVHTPITVLPPVEDEAGAWYLRVTDGIIQQRVLLDARVLGSESTSWLAKAAVQAGWSTGDEVVAVYTLQDASYAAADAELVYYGPGTHYTTARYQVVALLTSPTTIKLPDTNVYDVYRMYRNGVDMLPNQSVSWVVRESATIKSFNPEEGTLELASPVAMGDEIRVTYRCKPAHYQYRGFFDDTRFVDLDLNPSYGHTYDNGKPCSNLLSSVVYLYLLPSAVYRLSDANTTGEVKIYRAVDYDVRHVLRWESGPTVSVPRENQDKTRSYKIGVYGQAQYDREYMFSNILPNDMPGIGDVSSPVGTDLVAGGVGGLASDQSALVLAKIYVSSAGSISSVKIIDTRSRGGGLGENFKTTLPSLTSDAVLEANSCWDVSGWEGTPVMLNGVVVFELPKTLLTSYGGNFTERQIEEIIQRHVAAGTKPVVRYI